MPFPWRRSVCVCMCTCTCAPLYPHAPMAFGGSSRPAKLPVSLRATSCELHAGVQRPNVRTQLGTCACLRVCACFPGWRAPPALQLCMCSTCVCLFACAHASPRVHALLSACGSGATWCCATVVVSSCYAPTHARMRTINAPSLQQHKAGARSLLTRVLAPLAPRAGLRTVQGLTPRRVADSALP